MPRPLEVYNKRTGQTHTIDWKYNRDPTSSEIKRLLAEQESRPAPIPEPFGPIANKNRSFAEQSLFAPEPFKLEDVGAFNPLQGRNASEAMPLPQNQNAGVQQEAGTFRKVIDTLYGGEESYLPPIRGVTRPLLPKIPENVQIPGLPGMGPTDPRLVKFGYNEIVQPMSSVVGAATDWATGKVAGPIARAAAPYVKPLAKPLLAGAVRLGESYFPRAFPKKIPSVIGENAAGVLESPIRPTRALLPEVAASQQRRFYGGPEGMADSRARNTIDLGPSNTLRPEVDPTTGQHLAPTILPGEVAPGLVDVPAPVAGNYPLGRRAAEPLTDLERAHRRWLPEVYKKDAPVWNAVRDPRNIPDPNAGYYPGPRSRGDVGNLPELLPPTRTQRPRKLVDASNPGDTAAQDVLDNAKKSGVPEVVAAAGKAEATRPWRLRYDDLFTSISTQIANTGKAGKEIARKIGRARTISEQRAGTWIQKFEDATKDLNPKEFDDLVETLDKGIPQGAVVSPKISGAFRQVQALDKEVKDLAARSGMGYKTPEGKVVPWQSRENYWPHKFDPKELQEGTTIIDRIMKSEGISREEATKIVKNSNRFGEKLISEQHKRQLNVEGWRRDPNAMKQHLYDMADRISHAEELGPMDIVKGPLADLIEQTGNPNLVKRNLERVLNREMPVYGESIKGRFDRGLTKAAAASHLSQFSIGNFNQNAATMLRSNMSDFAKAVGSRIKNKGEFYREAQRSGVLETTMQDVYREAGGSGSKLSKLYGIRASEQFNRALASKTGKNKAERLFNQLKKNPDNAKAKSQLSDLLQRDVEPLLKGEKLPDEELSRAGGRMAEVTQGRAQTQDLPYDWKPGSSADVLTLYKKYAFRQGRIMLDAFKENPGKFMIIAAPLSAAMGEATGDLKATIRGGIKGTLTGEGAAQAAGKEIASRGEYMQKSLEKMPVPDQFKTPEVARVLENLSQAWFFGLPGNVIQALTQGGKQDVLEELTGPILGEAVGLAADTMSLTQGNVQPLARNLTRKIPFVGPGIQRAYFPTRRQSTKKTKRAQ